MLLTGMANLFGIGGAAIATLLSNIADTAYFILFILKKRGRLVLSMNPRNYTVRFKIPSEVFLVGLPSAIMNICGVTSNIVMDRLMSSYSNEALAGLGVAKKVDMLNYAISAGTAGLISAGLE